jgi:hypothetical protein
MVLLRAKSIRESPPPKSGFSSSNPEQSEKKPHLQSKEMRLRFFSQKPLIMGNHGSRIRFSNVERSEDIPIQQKGQDFEMLLNGAAHKEW